MSLACCCSHLTRKSFLKPDHEFFFGGGGGGGRRVLTVNKGSSVPTTTVFISDLLDYRQIIFGNMINIALEKSANLWKYDF